MKKVQRILSLILAVTIIFSLNICSFAAVKNETDVMRLLSELEIMSGDPDGNLRLNDYVTRAEFSKVAVNASSYKNSVAIALRVSPFSDVTYKHWAAPYVQVAVLNGICEGYTDATFKPDNLVSFEEAVTMLLRVLGYTDADFGISWPYGQVGMANNLDITKNVDAAIGDKLTRGQVATLVFNTLDAKMKSSQAKLIGIFDCTLVEDVTLISTKNENSSISSSKVYTTNGFYDINSSFNYSYVGKKGNLYVKNGDDIICFIPDDESGQELESYNVYQVLDKSIVVYNGSQRTEINLEDSTVFYNDTLKTTFASLKAQIEMGDVLYVKRNNDNTIDYVSYKKGNIKGPKTVLNQNWLYDFTNDTSSVKVMRNGVSVLLSEIKQFDVVYYLKDLNMVLAYSNKITGIYENATPNKDIPNTVTVSGKSYVIESGEAFNKLSSLGEFNYGDTVTLLLGKNNEIADVVSPDKSSVLGEVVGYVTGYGTKEIQKPDTSTYIGYYIKLILPDGNEYEYITNKSYDMLANSIVKLTFENGIARASSLRKTSTNYGNFDWDTKTLGNYKLSQNIKILDVATTDKLKKSAYTSVFPQRIDGLSLNDKVLYMKKNSNNEITELILSDVTGDAYTYALVTDVTRSTVRHEDGTTSKSNSTSSFRYNINGSDYNYNGSTSFTGIASGTPISLLYNSGGQLDYVKVLLKADGVVKELTPTKLTTSSATYSVSDKVTVYKRDANYNYTLSNLSDINTNDYTVNAYYDKSTNNGGRVRIIVAIVK